MKKFFLVVFLNIIIHGGFVYANSVSALSDNKDAAKKIERNIDLHVQKLKSEVQLTDSQEVEIRKIYEKLLKSRDIVQKKASLEERSTNKSDFNNIFLKELFEVLTPEQQQVLLDEWNDRVEKARKTEKK